MRGTALILCASSFIGSAYGQLRPAPGPSAENQTDYIVSFRPGTPAAERARVAGRAGAHVRFNYSIIDAAAVRVPNANVLAALQQDLAVYAVVPDRTMYALGKPGGGGSTGEVMPLGVTRVGQPRAGSDGAGIGVAILDTGIDRAHGDLAVSDRFFDGYGGTCGDVDGHGTHVAGVVAALQGNGKGTVGVAPKATPYCVKVLNDQGSGADSVIIGGIDWVVANATSVTPNIRVINMSLGRPKAAGDMGGALQQAIQSAYNRGIAVVVAAGNDQTVEVKDLVPAGFPEVIAVGATTAVTGANSCSGLAAAIQADTASFFTTDGKMTGGIGVTVSAPGEDREDVSRACRISSLGILSLAPGGGTARMSGTSQASPHVAGIVARILQMQGAVGVEKVRDQLRANPTFGTAPLNSPTSSYTFDGEREGVAVAP